MKNYVQRGDVQDFTAGADVSAGDVVAIKSGSSGHCGIAVGDYANGDPGAAYVEGVFRVPANTPEAWNQGDELFFDGTVVTTADGGGTNTPVGKAWQAKGSSETLGQAKLSGGN